MKIHKTKQSLRGVYNYHFADGSICTLVSDKDGITELDIKKLHSLDDSEVYYNNKNLRPKRTKEEKKIIDMWKQDYIKNFKSEHGYEPHEADVEYEARQAFPRNYNLSIDYDDTDFDKSEIGLLSANHKDDEFEWSEKMLLAMEELTAKQREVIELMFVEELKQHEVAKRLGISPAAVNKHFNKAKETIKKYF